MSCSDALEVTRKSLLSLFAGSPFLWHTNKVMTAVKMLAMDNRQTALRILQMNYMNKIKIKRELNLGFKNLFSELNGIIFLLTLAYFYVTETDMFLKRC